ncbi:hypothetical protein VU04_08875 [Desulfobulbus sp. TB]|nr:hypothetical protein [Desulfobulbus sp. TB]
MVAEFLVDELLSKFQEGLWLERDEEVLVVNFLKLNNKIQDRASSGDFEFSNDELLELNNIVSELAFKLNYLGLQEVLHIADDTIFYIKSDFLFLEKWKDDINSKVGENRVQPKALQQKSMLTGPYCLIPRVKMEPCLSDRKIVGYNLKFYHEKIFIPSDRVSDSKEYCREMAKRYRDIDTDNGKKELKHDGC